MQVSIGNLHGHWVLEKSLSDNLSDILKVQGVSWVIGKTLGVAKISLSFAQYSEENVDYIDMQQTATGIKGTAEKRALDWTPQPHKDHIFGTMKVRSRYIRGLVTRDGQVRPNGKVQTSVDDVQNEIGKFLWGEIDAEGNQIEGFLVEDPKDDKYGEGKGLWIHTLARELGDAWTAEQVWGFEIIDGQRYFSRRVVSANSSGDYKLCRFVYSLKGGN